MQVCGVCYADAATHGEVENFEQSNVQCFEDLQRGVEIAEASSTTPAASRKDRRGEPRCGTPAVSPTDCFYELNLSPRSKVFCLVFSKKVNLSHLWNSCGSQPVLLVRMYFVCVNVLKRPISFM